MIGIYKTHPESYATAARWLDLSSGQIMMVATHNNDPYGGGCQWLPHCFRKAPGRVGEITPPDPLPAPVANLVCDGLDDLADQFELARCGIARAAAPHLRSTSAKISAFDGAGCQAPNQEPTGKKVDDDDR